jgi:hypothetical protein
MPRPQASPFQLPKRRELAATPRTRIRLNHHLLHPGEELEIRICCEQTHRPPDRLTVFNHYLKKVDKSQTDTTLTWEPTDSGWETRTQISLDAVGSYLIKFSDGTRERLNPYLRYVAVIDERSTVCNLRHLLDSQMANYHNFYHQNYIPVDYELPFNHCSGKIETNPNWMGHQVYRYYQAKFGAQIIPYLDLCHLPFPQIPETLNPDGLTLAEATRRIQLVQDIWERDFQYLRPEMMSFECLNQNVAAAARACGLKGISGLKPDWKNQLHNLQGMPLFPYFINENDVRATAPGRNPMVGFMTTSHPLLSRDYVGYRLCPAEALQTRAASLENMQPLLQSLEELIQNRDPRTPLFLNLELQGHAIPEATRMNLFLLNYLLKNARRERVVFASRLEIADYFQRHFERTPERSFYLTDTWRDTPTYFFLNPTARHKAPCEHDSIYFENHKCRVLFRKSEMLPHYFYYYPEFTGQSLAEQPPSVDFSGIQVAIEHQFDPTWRIKWQIESPGNFSGFPMAFWDLPFALAEVKNTLQHNFSRFIPVNQPESKVLNAIAIVNLAAGINNFYLDFGVKVKGN